MGKTAKRPASKRPKAASQKRRPKSPLPRDGVLRVQPDPNMTAEQYRRQVALAEWLLKRARDAESMTPEQARQEQAEWQRFKRSINRPRAGYRKLYRD